MYAQLSMPLMISVPPLHLPIDTLAYGFLKAFDTNITGTPSSAASAVTSVSTIDGTPKTNRTRVASPGPSIPLQLPPSIPQLIATPPIPQVTPAALIPQIITPPPVPQITPLAPIPQVTTQSPFSLTKTSGFKRQRGEFLRCSILIVFYS